MRAPLCMTAPYWFQFVGIYLKDLLIMDIGIGMMGIYGLIVGIPMGDSNGGCWLSVFVFAENSCRFL